MPTFALEHIEEVKGKIDFYSLTVDGTNAYDQFEKELVEAGGYESELATLQVRMQQMAELQLMPETKCRDITPKKAEGKEYELKTKNLRCYLFHEEHKGRIVVMLTKKKPKSQQRDIKRFRKIKEQYLNQK